MLHRCNRKEKNVRTLFEEMAQNKIITMVVVAVVADTIFGCGRAIRERKFNSCVGIDGAIRTIAMVISIVFLGIMDLILKINLIGFIPESVRVYFPEYIKTIGMAEFFGILYLCYEVVSILKNMTLCGLPVKKVWKNVKKTLEKYTDGRPDND